MNLVSGFQETESKVRNEIYGCCAMQRVSSLQVKYTYLGAGRTVKWDRLRGQVMLRKLAINAGETKGGHGFRLRRVIMRLAC